jgi:FtsZ-interacting cell division protein YlmF
MTIEESEGESKNREREREREGERERKRERERDREQEIERERKSRMRAILVLLNNTINKLVSISKVNYKFDKTTTQPYAISIVQLDQSIVRLLSYSCRSTLRESE